MGNQFGSKPTNWKRGDALTAEDLNRIAKSAVQRIRGGPGVKVRAGINEVVLSADQKSKTPYIGRLVVSLVADLGGGYYSWTRLKGEGPDTGQGAGTGVSDTRALEVTGATGITGGTKVLIFRIEGVWYFSKSSSSGGDGVSLITSYDDQLGNWGCFGRPSTDVGSAPSSFAAAGSSFSGHYGEGERFPNLASTSTLAVTGAWRWKGGPVLSFAFADVGARGFRIRIKCVFSGASVGAEFDVKFGVISPNTASTAHGTAFVIHHAGPGDDAAYADLIITQANLAGVFAYGDMLRPFIEVTQTVLAVGARSMDVRLFGFEFDGTG